MTSRIQSRNHELGAAFWRWAALGALLAGCLCRGAFAQQFQNQQQGFNSGLNSGFNSGFNSNSQNNQQSAFGSSPFGRSGTSNRNKLNQNSTDSTNSSSRRQSAADKRNKGNPFNNQNANGPQRAKPQAKSKIPVKAAGKAASAAGAAGNFPKLQISDKIQTETVYFAPPDITTKAGQRFSTPIFFYNPDNRQVDRVDLWIRYTPELLDPEWVNVSALNSKANSPIEPEVWRSQGFIHLSCELAQPAKEMVQPLATINWAALHASPSTTVFLQAPEGKELGIYEGTTNILEISKIGNEGIVSMQARIIDPDADENPTILEVKTGEDPFMPSAREGRGVHLALMPTDDEVHPGEVSTIDIALVNPDVVGFDEIRFRIRFDPEAVEILDADEDNYITDGVNIYDGGFHDREPFENHGKNHVDSLHGIIDYVMGSAKGLRPYPSGTVARIVFRMKRVAGSTAFWFDGLDPKTNQYASDVRANGRSLLGPANGRGVEGLHNALIYVAPL